MITMSLSDARERFHAACEVLADVAADQVGLTRRERHVLALSLAGYGARGGADKMRISQRTWKYYAERAMKKLGRSSTAGMCRAAAGVFSADENAAAMPEPRVLGEEVIARG